MFKSITVLALLIASPLTMWAQTETGKSAIEGRVLDPSGNAVQGAEVNATETQTGFRRKTSTTGDGKFRFSSMPVGLYTIEVAASGFGAAKSGSIEALVGETKSLTISLTVATVNTAVTVEAFAEIVNQADTNNSTLINERAIENLPIRGRNFTEFIQLSPNVMQEGNRYGIVVNGQRSINSNISVDGVDFNDSLQGGQRGGGPNESAYFFPQLAVREFQVVRDGASAEVGRTNSGYVNVVTKSGTNNLHGAGFYANRNGSMTSPDAFGNDSSSNSQNQFGGSLGGPIRSDKLFFFAALEKNLVTIPYTVRFATPSVAIPADIASQQGQFDQKNNPLVSFGRLDYQLSQSTTVNIQYTYAAQYGLNFGGQSGQTNQASTNNTILDRASQAVKGASTTVLSGNLINEVRGQYAYDNRTQQPNSRLAEITINDLGTLGGSKNGTYIYNATRYEVLDNLTWTRGRHTLKFGVDFNINPQQQQRETNYGGVYTFATLADYVAALGGNVSKVQQYQQSIAANGTQGQYHGTQQDHSVFVTDSIRLRPDLTITAGLRWEGQIHPQPPSPNAKYSQLTGHIPNDLKMWQPRLGLAWNVGAKGSTVVRISAGMFDARTPGYLLQRVFTDNGINTVILDTATDPNLFKFLTVPNSFASLPAGLKTPTNSIYAFDPSFRNPRSGQAAITLEQQLDKNTKITIGYTHNATWSLQRRVDTNLFAPTVFSNGLVVYPAYDSNNNLIQASGYNAATGVALFVDGAGKAVAAKVARPDSTLGQINVNKSVAHSSYNGTSVSIQRRMSGRLQFGFNYTCAFNRDDDSNERDFNRQTTLNTFNMKSDASYSKNDIRNSGNINALYRVGRGFTISTLFFARTGIPVKPVVGSDSQNDGNAVNDRPVINGLVAARDAFRQPGMFDWDMRVLKEFKLTETMRLDLSIEGFNLTRSSNKTFNGDGETAFGKPQATVNPRTGLPFANNNATIPTFAPGTDRFGGPRQGQIGLRLIF